MTSMKAIRLETVCVAVAVLLLTSCGGIIAQNVTSHNIQEWQVGTSSLMLDEWTQDEFHTFSENGIQLLEIYLGSQLGKTDDEVSEWVTMVKERTEAAGIKVWSIHLPFSRALDISSSDEDARRLTIEEHRRVIRLFRPLDIRTYVIHGSFEPIMDNERSERMANARHRLKCLQNM